MILLKQDHCLMKFLGWIKSLRHRKEFPLPWLLVLRFTSELFRLRFRLQADPPETEDDQKFPFVPSLLKLPEVDRLPAGAQL